MRNAVAKYLRREARDELAAERAPARDLVLGHRSVINSPHSVRALYQRMKRALKQLRSSTSHPQHFVARQRKSSTFARPQINAPLALICSPLKQLEGRYSKSSGIYIEAAAAAKRGDGQTVQAIASSYL